MTPDPATLCDIICERREVYGLDLDSRIRTVSNRLTARAFHELLERLDDESPDFAKGLDSVLADFPVYGPDILIGFDDGATPSLMGTLEAGFGDEAVAEETETAPYEPNGYYLKLVFSDEAAAYYQFPLFPDLHQEAMMSVSRKRTGDSQLLRIEFDRAGALQAFTEKCRENPHLIRIEESTAEEFHQAQSDAV